MTGISSRKLALTLLASSALATPSLAQSVLPAPPVFQTIDSNGVDVESGKIVFGLGSISIGPGGPGSLSFQWSTDAVQMISIGGYLGSNTTPTTDTIYVTVAGSTESFSAPHGTYAYTQDQGRASTLSYNAGTDIYTYTAADGTVGIFTKNLASGSPPSSYYGLISLTYPAGQALNYYYVYRATGNYDLRVITSSLGYQLRFTRDSNGGIISAVAFNMYSETCDPQAASCTLTGTWPSLTWDAPNSNIVDSTNRTVHFAQTSSQVQISYPSGRTLTWNLNSLAVPPTVNNFTDGKGTWQYRYSPNPAGGTTLIFNPDNAPPRAVSFLNSGLVTDDRPIGSSVLTHYTYDSKNRTTDVSWTDGSLTSKTHYGYDARGNLNEVRQVSTTPGTPADIVTTASYPSSCSNLKTCNQPDYIIDPRGNRTDFTYDPNSGGVATITQPAATTGAVRPQTRFTYTQLSANYRNPSGQIIAGPPMYQLTSTSQCQTQSACSGTSDEVKTSITYGPNDALMPVSTSTGDGTGTLTATTATTYYGTADVNTVDGPLSGSADTVRSYIDLMRRPLGTIGPDPDGAGPLTYRAIRLTYDNDGRPTTKDVGTAAGQGDNDLNTMTSLQQQLAGYDAQGRVSTIRSNAGGTTYGLSQRSYTNAGSLDCQAVRMNPATFASPPSSACTLATQGSYGPDRVTKYTYDSFFHVVSVTSGYGTPAAATDVTNTYDTLQRLLTIKDAESNLTTFEYDGMNRRTKTRYPVTTKGSGTSSATDYEQLGYDAASNITSRRLRDGNSIGFTFDNLNRVTAKDLPGSEPDVSYAYDNLGRLTSASQTGNSLTFTYDALSRKLTEVGPQGTATSAYDLAGRRTQLTYPGSGLYLNYDYLVTGDLSAVRENGAITGVGVLANYGYDNLGNRTNVTFGNGVSQTLTYDAVSRLASLTNTISGISNNPSATFAYNPASQMTQTARTSDGFAWTGHGNGSTSFTQNGLNQQITIGGSSATWDSKGNLTSEPQSGKNYGYSSENLMTSASGGVTMSYDPAMRLYQVAAAATTRFAYDDLKAIADYDGSNTIQHRYVFAPGVNQPIVEYAGGGTSSRTFLSSDERGSIIARSDNSGTLGNALAYDEYGKPASTNVGRFQYTGQMWLGEANVYYYKARNYLPQLGIFAQTDPAGYGAGLNVYAYVLNDPVNFADPDGLQSTGCAGNSTATCSDQGNILIIATDIFRKTPGAGDPTTIVCGNFGCDTPLFNPVPLISAPEPNLYKLLTSGSVTAACPTASSIDSYLRSKSSPAAGYGSLFISEGARFNIDPRFPVSIMGAETGFGRRITSGRNNLFNNLWNGSNSWFESYTSSIHSEFHMLAGANYSGLLGSTGSFYAKYCNGADCANGLNNMNTFLREQGGNPFSLRNPCPGQGGRR